MITMPPRKSANTPRKTPAQSRAVLSRSDISLTAVDTADFTELAAHLCNTPAAFVAVMSDDKILFSATRGFRASQDSQLNTLCARVIAKNALLQIPDTIAAGITPALVTTPKKRAVRFYSGVPFPIAGGTLTGVLGVLGFQPQRLDKAARAALILLGRQLAAVFQRDHYRDKLSEADAKLKRHSLFNSVRARASQVISTARNVHTMLQA
ncbi:diguanylate cyclase with GAF sensor, partial [mine drainage metagenome]